jgi:hypothetical protein
MPLLLVNGQESVWSKRRVVQTALKVSGKRTTIQDTKKTIFSRLLFAILSL